MQEVINILKKTGSDNNIQVLCDLMPLSYAEICDKYHDVISSSEAEVLFRYVQKQKKKNTFIDAKIVTENNPQIKNNPFIYTKETVDIINKRNFIPDRTSEYVEPEMVSSMFSPAAYLTELYREARELHKRDSKYYLDKRRPDLKDIALSQENLTDELSVLELSNEILFSALKENSDNKAVLKRLSEKYQSVKLPYHEPFLIIRNIVTSKKIFSIINKIPSIINSKVIDKDNIKNICCNISPSVSFMLNDIYLRIEHNTNIDYLVSKYIVSGDFNYLFSLKNVMTYFKLTNKEFNLLMNFAKLDNITDKSNNSDKLEYKRNVLKIKGVVCLCKVMNLPLESVVFILKSFNCTYANKNGINAAVNFKIVRDSYTLPDSDIAVLLGGSIVKDEINNEKSQFDCIFNTPPLGGGAFTDDNTDIDLFNGNYLDGSHERFIINSLKRAFGVNETELAELCKFIYGKEQIVSCNITFLSLFYRAALLARINNISVHELVLLCSLLPSDMFNGKLSNYTLSDVKYKIYDLLYNINSYATWIYNSKLSIPILHFLLNDSYDIVVSQGVKNITSVIRNGFMVKDFFFKDIKKEQNKVLSRDDLIKKISPGLSSELDINSVRMMESVLLWLDSMMPKEYKIIDFFRNIVISEGFADEKINKIITNLIKISSIVGVISIDDILLSSWMEVSGIFDGSDDKIKYDLSTIRMMMAANVAIESTGEKSSLVISELTDKKLSSKTLSASLDCSEKIIDQIFKKMRIESINNYSSLVNVVDILNLFSQTGISPDDFIKLFGINNKEDYESYHDLSGVAESILETDELELIKGSINKERSLALSALYFLEKMPDTKEENKNSNEVYKYLLIDTDISETIKTTKIAEAIAAIQLYISNCLNNIEESVSDTVRTRSFFRDWEEYNRRYSTWAGLSMLVYYPENYVEPTIRIGKTAMMDKLQQLISQSDIKREEIDNAFCSYLTEFEQIANLNVISAYHDNIDIKKGKTYFIGNSDFLKGNYYIRSVDHEKVIENGNNIVIPSLAWSGWEKINCGMNPYKGIIRSVIFNNKLYIIWLEHSVVKISKGEEGEDGNVGIVEKVVKYEVKLFFSYLNYDNTWSTPDYIDLSPKIYSLLAFGFGDSSAYTLGFYCSTDIDSGDLFCAFYAKEEGIEGIGAFPFYLSGEHVIRYVDSGNIVNVSKKIEKYIDKIDKNNKTEERKVINVYYDKDVGIIHDSSDDAFSQYVSGSEVAAVVIESTGSGFDSANNKYNFGFKFGFMLNKMPLLFGDERDVYYAAHIDICKSLNWQDCNVSHSISYLERAINTGYGQVIDSIVFIFNKTENKYTLFLYNSLIKERVTVENNFFSIIRMILRIDGEYTNHYDVNKIQNELIVFETEKNIIFCIEDVRGSVNFDLRCSSGDSYARNTVKTKDLFYRDLGSISISAKFSLNDNVTDLTEGEWRESKDIGNGSIKYGSKSNAFSIEFSEDKISSFENKKISFDLLGKSDSVAIFKYSCACYINVFNDERNLIGIKKNECKAQYLEFNMGGDVKKRIRLNTLFANKLVLMAGKGVDNILLLNNQDMIEPDIDSDNCINQVPMDFNGANALYFWEMFYYVPMMITDILLQHQNYNEAERWLRYIFNPAGYIENGRYSNRYWNVKPLVDDTAWNEMLPDETNPDAIALADPMHYKMATFMKTLDLIIARGDYAYRELERDTLNEAKSRYMQALALLGQDTAALMNKGWTSPTLADAANKTAQSAVQSLLMSAEDTKIVSGIAERSANTLMKVFKPQLNDKLISYRIILNQRLLNLRNGLSINGQRLYLPIFSSSSDPRILLESQVNNINSERPFNLKSTLMYRFPLVIENAKNLVSQLIEFGGQLLSFNERRDDEQLAELLIHQGSDLLIQSISIQNEEIKNLQAEKRSLLSQQREIIHRAKHYETLHSEYILPEEAGAMILNTVSANLSGQSRIIKGMGMLVDLAPNIFGVAAGGSEWSAGTECASELMGAAAETMQGLAYPLEKGAEYSRRAQEWQLESASAREEEKQIEAELDAINIQITAAQMQKHYITTEQRQNQQQLQFLQRKFTRAQLYGWLRGRLMAIYSPFYDLAVSRCFMAEKAYRYEMNINAEDRSFINTSAWKGSYSGLMAGESLMLNLAQLEDAYLEKDKRVLEVTRTVSLAEVYNSEQMGNDKFSFDQVSGLVSQGILKKLGNEDNYVALISTREPTNSKELQAVIRLDGLSIYTDYPADLGQHRLIMQISVTLPALIEPYQNVRALLEYEGKDELPEGCKAIAVSHGMNDSGLFHLQFGDSAYLPFEGLAVNSKGKLKLRFFDVGGGDQKRLLQTLTDIVLHIRYTIY